METYHKKWNIRMLLIVATIFAARVDDARGCTGLTISDEKSGNIQYHETYNRNCYWRLPKPSGEDHILVLKVFRLSLKARLCSSYLTITGIPSFYEIGIRCLIFARLSNFDTEQAYAAANSLRSSCHGGTWIILRERLPAEVNLTTCNIEQKSIRLDYEYISFGALDTTATATSAKTTSGSDYSTLSDIGVESHSNASTIHFGIFAAVVCILAVLLILCALVIVLMQRRHKKLELTSNALRGSIRAATRIQASTIQRVDERQQPSEPNEQGAVNIGYNSPQTYAEIAGCSTAVSGSTESQYHQVSYVNQSVQSRHDDIENATYTEAGSPEPQHVNHNSQMYVNQQEMESDDDEPPSAQYAVLNKKSWVVQ